MMRLKSLLTFVLFAAGMLMLMSAMTGRSRVSTLGCVGLWVGAVTTIVLAAVLKVEKLSDVVRSWGRRGIRQADPGSSPG